MQRLQRGFLLRQALLSRAAGFGRHVREAGRVGVLSGVVGGWVVGGGGRRGGGGEEGKKVCWFANGGHDGEGRMDGWKT